jgi:hypothetical protein
MKRLLIVLTIAGMLSACGGSDKHNETRFTVDGVVLAAQGGPAPKATPGPTAAPARRARGALLLNAGAVPDSISDCAFPARQKGRRLLFFWDSRAIFSPPTLDDNPRALANVRVAIEGRVERSERNARACSLFAESVRRK